MDITVSILLFSRLLLAVFIVLKQRGAVVVKLLKAIEEI